VTSRRSQSGTRTIRALAIPGASTTSLSSSPAAPARICLRGKLLCSSGEESGAERDAASGGTMTSSATAVSSFGGRFTMLAGWARASSMV
jgi:hypothetical protein